MGVREAIALDKKLGEPRQLAEDIVTLGNANINLGKVDEAAENYRDALQLCLDNGDYDNAASASTNLAGIIANQDKMPEAITLLRGCCDNEKLSIRQPAQHFGPNGAHQRSIEIAVDQRQHIGKAGQIGAEFFSIFKRMTPFVQADIERFVRRVNSQTESDDQERCASATSVPRAATWRWPTGTCRFTQSQLTRAIA